MRRLAHRWGKYPTRRGGVKLLYSSPRRYPRNPAMFSRPCRSTRPTADAADRWPRPSSMQTPVRRCVPLGAPLRRLCALRTYSPPSICPQRAYGGRVPPAPYAHASGRVKAISTRSVNVALSTTKRAGKLAGTYLGRFPTAAASTVSVVAPRIAKGIPLPTPTKTTHERSTAQPSPPGLSMNAESPTPTSGAYVRPAYPGWATSLDIAARACAASM